MHELRWITPLMLTVLILWDSAALGAAEVFSHADWTTVLERFVDPQGRVDYRGLATDRAVFDRYVAAIEETSPASRPEIFPRREEALAYYLNAYNAQVFNGVLARGPEEKSVWRGWISGFAFFVRMRVTLGGESMSLKQLEDRLIREGFNDPRVHAALNCASISCPRLPQRAFVAAQLDAQLDAAMGEFVSAPQHFRLDRDERTVYLSQIFDFFPGDFLDFERRHGNASPRIVDYVNRFRDSDAQVPRDFRVKYLAYDKGINQQ